MCERGNTIEMELPYVGDFRFGIQSHPVAIININQKTRNNENGKV